jgi:FkbM family methyltransferase
MSFQIDFIAGHSFRSDVLGPDSVVLDLGLNTGEFALELIERYGCRVLGVEALPDPIAAIRNPPDELKVEQAAIAPTGGTIAIRLGAGHCPTALADLAPEDAETLSVPAITLPELLAKHALGASTIDLLKVDIEGVELDMLEDASDDLLLSVAQWSIEYHDFIEPAHRPRIDALHRRFEALGFQRLNVSRTRNLDVMYLGPETRVSRLTKAWALARFKYLRGAGRVLRRRN